MHSEPEEVSCLNRSLGSACVILLILTILFTNVGRNPAYAHFNTLAPDTDVTLHWPLNNSYSMSVDLKIVKAPTSEATIFWGHQFSFMNGERGYIAVGIGGNYKVATVGIFDAVNANPYNSSGVCNNEVSLVSQYGQGWQCFTYYNWTIGNNYRLRISKLTDVNGSETWQGSVYDSTNSTTVIGTILVDPIYGGLGMLSSTWDEYTYAGSCDTTPTSVVFSYPYAMNAAGNHAPTRAQATYGNTTCGDSNISYLGGGAYQADAGRNVTRTTPAESWLWTQEPTLVPQTSASLPEFQQTPPMLLAVPIHSSVALPDYLGASPTSSNSNHFIFKAK